MTNTADDRPDPEIIDLPPGHYRLRVGGLYRFQSVGSFRGVRPSAEDPPTIGGGGGAGYGPITVGGGIAYGMNGPRPCQPNDPAQAETPSLWRRIWPSWLLR